MNDSDTAAGCGCLAWIVVLAVNLTLGTMSVNYLIAVWLEKDIPWLGDMIIGIIGGELTIPLAVITWLLRWFGAI